MGSRGVGAFLAIAAALLFAVALLTSAWWNGHPSVGGKSRDRFDVHIGLYAGDGCKDGETVVCQAIDMNETFRIIGYAELGLGGLATILALALGIATWRLREARATLAKLVLAAALAAAVTAVALIVVGPLDAAKNKGVDVPIGWGLMLFGGGVVCAIAASIAAPRARAQPLRLKTAPPPAQHQPAFDVRELLRDEHDSVRPAALGPEPMMGRASVPPSPGGQLAGPAGPLGPQHGNAPLFQQAPSLRPLYEVGGAALPTLQQPHLPSRAPTPLSREAIEAFSGRALPTPQPIAPIGPGVLDGGTIRSLPPPTNATKPATRPSGRTTPPNPAAARPSAPTLAHSVPPPPTDAPAPLVKPARDTRLPTDADDRLDHALRDTEAITSVEVDAEAKAAAGARAPTDDATDTGIAAARSNPTDTDQMETVGRDRISSEAAIGDKTDSAVATMPVERVDREDSVPIEPPRAPRAATEAVKVNDLLSRLEHRAETIGPSAPGAEPGDDEPAGQERRPSQVPISTAPSSLPPPEDAQVATSGPTPACPQCESPMAWVEEHLRFYCKQCRMYF